MESFRIDEIARKLRESLPPAILTVQKDIENNFRSVLRSALGKLDVVTREEFDTQTKVLERTRARLEQLEARVQAWEGGAPAAATSGASATDGTPAGGSSATGSAAAPGAAPPL
ncbi:MAG TPA: accessory factor UbiK family protein [Steroidobacteraceae bacterium]|jgi:hypothetical protein